jgi:hypothetical protein
MHEQQQRLTFLLVGSYSKLLTNGKINCSKLINVHGAYIFRGPEKHTSSRAKLKYI